MGDFLSADVLKVVIPLTSGIVAWLFNEIKRRSWEEYRRKEERYQKLLRAIWGFYIETRNPALVASFLDELNACWLYCPDEVIRKGYAFLLTVHTQEASDECTRQKAMGDFVSTIRKDLLSRKIVRQTELGACDFKHYVPTLASPTP